VAEGSTLGAAVLLEAAAAQDLHGHYGARHLAPSPLGVAGYWTRTRGQLDAVALDRTGQLLACVGARMPSSSYAAA
jgi:heme oxygenase